MKGVGIKEDIADKDGDMRILVVGAWAGSRAGCRSLTVQPLEGAQAKIAVLAESNHLHDTALNLRPQLVS
ncbi:MAG TPA: hypothetical protein VNO32_17735 [Candidatus Acidoferrum sp.]|nr:hypothetical protein [Candidatus Acidoferrum sp.]